MNVNLKVYFTEANRKYRLVLFYKFRPSNTSNASQKWNLPNAFNLRMCYLSSVNRTLLSYITFEFFYEKHDHVLT